MAYSSEWFLNGCLQFQIRHFEKRPDRVLIKLSKLWEWREIRKSTLMELLFIINQLALYTSNIEQKYILLVNETLCYLVLL